MKKNLTLLGILLSLLLITYYVYEVGEHKEKIREAQKKQLFRPDELGAMLSMSNAVVTLVRKGENFYTSLSKTLVDDRKLDSVFNVLSGVRAMRILKTEEFDEERLGLMFPEEDKYKLKFSFEKGELSFIFGEKIKFDQTFYLQTIWNPHEGEGHKKIMVAEDVSAAKGMYNKENYHLSDRKYKRLLTILYLDAEFFYETRPFHNKTEMHLQRVSFISEKQRPFTLNFIKETTTPPPLTSDVAIQQNKVNKARLEWARLEASRVSLGDLVDPDDQPLLKVLTSWAQSDGSESQLELSLYQSPAKKEFWLQVEGRDKTYIFEKRPDVFFAALQDFWHKTPQLPEAQHIVVQRGKRIESQKLFSFFSAQAHSIGILKRWPKKEGVFLTQIADSADDSEIFDVYRVQNELHLRDPKRGLVYRYFNIPEWARKSHEEEEQ